MSAGLYSGVSGLALGTGLYKGTQGLWGGSSGLVNEFGASLALDFLAGAPLDSRITFSRTTNATLVDATGRVTYAPNNLFIRSEEFDDAAWSKTNSTIAANVTTAPNGTLTADKHIPNNGATIGAGAAETRVQRSPTATLGVNYVFSIYAKAGEYDQVELALISTPSVSAVFSLTSGTVVSGTGASITPVGDGWYRCAIITTAGATGALAVRWSAKSSTVSVGDGVSGIFAWGAQLEEVTYQTLPSTYVQTVTSAYYGPRFDYNPVTLAPRGLLIEEQRTNLALYSEQFDNVLWIKSNATVTANAATSPDGTTNADKLLDSITNTTHAVNQVAVAAAVAGVTYTFSVFIKAAERGFAFVGIFGGALNTPFVSINLTTGSVAAVNGTVVSSSSTAFGNGWWRVTITATTIAIGNVTPEIRVSADGLWANRVYVGNGTGIFVWGAQLEAGSFATSYIPTVASTVTRAADIAVMTGTNFSSWYNASEGTFVSSFEASPNTFTTYVAASNGVVAQNSMHMDNDGAGNMRAAYYSGSSAVALLSLGAVGTIGAVNTMATAYSVDDFAASRNGGAVVTDTAGAVPVGVNRLNIGADPSGAAVNVSNRCIRSITYYPQRLANAQLQALAS